MKTYKRTTIMTAYRVRCLKGSGLSHDAVARKLGIAQSTVSSLLVQGAGVKQQRIADRMAYFGMMDSAGNSRKLIRHKHGEPTQWDTTAVYTRDLHHDDPLAILIADERFGRKNRCLDVVPERIDTPQHERTVTHDDTWEEYVLACGGIAPALIGNGERGGKLAAEGTYVSSSAVRDLRYEYGYPYRNTLRERLLVARYSVLRRQARARDGQKFLAAQEEQEYST